MTDPELIKLILNLVASGDFGLTFHAKSRMNQRGVVEADIQNAARTSHHEKVQDRAKGKIIFEGLDLDGDDLEVVAAYEAGAVIISVF